MKLVFYNEEGTKAEKSIFLAGPTLRNSDFGRSWRCKAVAILDELGFTGDVYIPEFSIETKMNELDTRWKDLHKWEWDKLEKADLIVFWIPRDDEKLPGFTTNVEFGFWMSKDPNKVVLGYPKYANRMMYLQDLYDNFGGIFNVSNRLEDTLKTAVTALNAINKVKDMDNFDFGDEEEDEIEDAEF